MPRVVRDEASLDVLVARLLKCGAPKLLAWVVIMVFFCQDGLPAPPQEGFQVAEFFCGDGKIGKSCRYGQIRTAMLDINRGDSLGNRMENPFDLSTDAGFALLVFAFFTFVFSGR